MKHARKDYNHIQDPAGKIPEDEPVFLLRGQDKYAARVLRFYAARVEADGGDIEIVRGTRAQANLMDDWPVHKAPDIPKTDHASDCAVHNAPACLPGPCDCGAKEDG